MTPDLMAPRLPPSDCVLSIIIVNWNTRQVTLDCLESMSEECSKLSCEIIVVDNASKDGSADAIESTFPDVRVIRSPTNLGFAGGNNRALAEANGRIMALINSDVIVLPRCLETMLRFMDEHPDVGLASPRILNRDRTLQPNCLTFPSYWNRVCETFALHRLMPDASWLAGTKMMAGMHNGTRDVDILVGSFWVVRREAYREVGGLDDGYFMYGEDMDWCRRFRRCNWRVVYHPAAEAIHLGGASSSSQPVRFFIELQRSILRYWKTYHGRIGWLYCALMMSVQQLLRIPANGLIYLVSPSQRDAAGHRIRRSTAFLAWLLRLNRADSSARTR